MPLDDGTTTCPWAGEQLGQHQATIKLSDTNTQCSGDQASVITIEQNVFKIKVCQSTNPPAGTNSFKLSKVSCLMLILWNIYYARLPSFF